MTPEEGIRWLSKDTVWLIGSVGLVLQWVLLWASGVRLAARLLLGSIHRWVVRDAPCGVLVWPRCKAQGARVNRFLLKPA